MCSLQCALCHVQRVVCIVSVLCLVCNVPCMVCSMDCTEYIVCHNPVIGVYYLLISLCGQLSILIGRRHS